MKTQKKIVQKLFFALAITSLISASAFAQLAHTTLGIKGGMNISKLSVSGLQDPSNRIGYDFGAFMCVGFLRKFAIEPNVLISTKGILFNYKNFGTGGTIVSIKYLDVPVVGMYYFTKHINLQFGPYASYLLKTAAMNTSSSDQTNAGNQINKNSFKRMDYGLVGGIGFELGGLNAGVRYIQGLTNIGNDTGLFGQSSFNFADGKNSAWQLSKVLTAIWHGQELSAKCRRNQE